MRGRIIGCLEWRGIDGESCVDGVQVVCVDGAGRSATGCDFVADGAGGGD